MIIQFFQISEAPKLCKSWLLGARGLSEASRGPAWGQWTGRVGRDSGCRRLGPHPRHRFGAGQGGQPWRVGRERKSGHATHLMNGAQYGDTVSGLISKSVDKTSRVALQGTRHNLSHHQTVRGPNRLTQHHSRTPPSQNTTPYKFARLSCLPLTQLRTSSSRIWER